MPGTLYIVGTPIGNLEDISPRVKRTLNEVDAIFAEDTRVSIKLLSHIGVSKTLISCHDYNESGRTSEMPKFASEGKSVALISDAGMPLVSDPGYKMVREAIQLGMKVVAIPGPSSVLQALVASGLPSERFAFEGFLPDKSGERRKRLEKLKDDDRTLIFFLPITDINKVLTDINEIMGNRDACLCREMTKFYEEYIRASVLDILEIARTRQLKGECVLVLAGTTVEQQMMTESNLLSRLESMLSSGARLKDAAALLSKETGWASSEIYKLGLKLREDRST